MLAGLKAGKMFGLQNKWQISMIISDFKIKHSLTFLFRAPLFDCSTEVKVSRTEVEIYIAQESHLLFCFLGFDL